MADYDTQSGEPTPPDTTKEGRRRLEFPANIILRTLSPREGTPGPSLVQFVMWHDRLPFQFVVESPDVGWLKAFAASIVDAALEISQNPENAQFEGKQPIDDVTQIDPVTFEGRTVDSSTEESSSEKE